MIEPPPAIAGSCIVALTWRRVFVSTKTVPPPGSLPIGLSSILYASNVPAGTVTFSMPVTSTTYTFTCCESRSK